MLTIEVAAVNGAPPPTPMSARFGDAGGSIGRDVECTLVLPDAEKRISRRHVLIDCRAGRFSLRSQGSAIPVLVNGAPVDYGAEAPLTDGDRIDIGEYSLQVRGDHGAAQTVAPARSPAARPGDILADFGASPSAADPFADLIPPAQVRPPAPPRRASAPSSSPPPLIPEDFDPFAEPLAPSPSAAPAAGRSDFSDLVPPSKQNVDELFGLRGGDPFPPGHPLAAASASATPGPAGIDDLLGADASMPVPRPAPAPAQRDDASELSARMRLPDFAQPLPPQTPAAPAPPAAGASGGQSPNTSGGMMLSWDERGDEGVFDGLRTMVIGGKTTERRRGERRQSASPAPAAAVAPPPSPGDAAEQELLQALLEGLGLERWPQERGADAETMRRVGRLLRAAVQGTIDLLRARATIKSEVQAHMTMIVARDNNPLKFSPNAEAALAHLLGPAQRGFMSSTAAMDDAYRDLVAHQFGFTAGTRAALADVLRRFDPASLEERLAGKSFLESVLPAHRKAKLWDLFAERFAQMSTEAEDDFQRLFGKEFLRAYEAQVAKMSSPQRSDKD